MIIAQISDTHILEPAAEEPEGARRAENLRRCVDHINHQGVDAVLHTGDSVQYGVAAEYAHLREILGGLHAPFFIVPGNRDRNAALREAFGDQAYLPETGEVLHYAVEDLSLRLIALDSTATGERKGVFPADRRAWLEETLDRAPERPTVLFIHHPPFDIDPHFVGGYRRPREARDLAAAVSRHPQVIRLMCGHVHRLHRTPWGGTVATTMPAVAVDLRKGVDPAIGEAPMYILHELSEDGALVSHARVVAD